MLEAGYYPSLHEFNMSSMLEILAPGLLTTIQDALGRRGYERYGVAVGGALDPFSAAAANILVGNSPASAVLEITVNGPTIRFSGSTVIALAGADLGAVLDGQPLEPGWSRLVRPGAQLEFQFQRVGTRAYLAIAGGIDVPRVLGSHSADLRAGFAGFAGRSLRIGDRLAYRELRTHAAAIAGRYLPAAAPGRQSLEMPVRVLPGPHLDRFEPHALEEFCEHVWRVADQSDRMGMRLVGPIIRLQKGAGVASVGLPVGAIEVPGDGGPIVLLADHPPTGGYAVLACAIRADLRLLAQRAPGESVRFVHTSPAIARRALQDEQSALAAIVDDLALDQVRWSS